MIKAAITFFILAPLTMINYALRKRRIIPDRWFWADKLMLTWGHMWALPYKWPLGRWPL